MLLGLGLRRTSLVSIFCCEVQALQRNGSKKQTYDREGNCGSKLERTRLGIIFNVMCLKGRSCVDEEKRTDTPNCPDEVTAGFDEVGMFFKAEVRIKSNTEVSKKGRCP